MNEPNSLELSKVAFNQLPIAHVHIFLVLRTLLENKSITIPNRPLRILDIGCGDGRLIDSLMRLAQSEIPNIPLEIYGFDIGEQGYQDGAQKNEAERYLEIHHPGTVWKDRIKIVSGDARWGYDEGFFDMAVSNQVIEHVLDLEQFMENFRHSVSSEGASIHLFPMRHCIQEAHCHVPFAHWISNFDYRVAWIALMSRLGIGRYRKHRVVLGHGTPEIHALETAKYIQCWTTYRTFAQIAEICRNKSLSISYHFTKDFFFTKLRLVLGLRPAKKYHKWTLLGLEWLSFTVCRHLSSSTLVICPLSYDIGARIAAEKANKNAMSQFKTDI
jgi:SAM-dependent methyltransferase